MRKDGLKRMKAKSFYAAPPDTWARKHAVPGKMLNASDLKLAASMESDV